MSVSSNKAMALSALPSPVSPTLSLSEIFRIVGSRTRNAAATNEQIGALRALD